MNGMSLFSALPELFITIMLVVMLIVDAFVGANRKGISVGLIIITLIAAMGIQYFTFLNQQSIVAFGGLFILDRLAYGIKEFIYLFSLIIVIYSTRYISERGILKGEFYAVFLFAILGMLVMVSANNMLVLYVGLELLSLALYALVAFDRDNAKATEAAMKFFILGALASGILLYGISLVYGATHGSLQLEMIISTISMGKILNYNLLLLGLVFIVAGLVFKLGLVPFHMWIPDVYEGASLVVTTIIASITKLAAVIFVIRFLIYGFMPLHESWATMLQLVAILSLFLGNIVAISQTSIKRMLGYSAVSHMGFVALGIMVAGNAGLSAAIFYIVTYSLTSIAGFGVLIALSRGDYECDTINDLSGLGRKNPVYAGAMLLVMFSLAGIPPLVGFYAKFRILSVLIQSGYTALAIYAVIMSLIGAFYYLRIVKVMYFEEATNNALIISSDTTLLSNIVLLANSVLVLLFGIFPQALTVLCSLLVSQ